MREHKRIASIAHAFSDPIRIKMVDMLLDEESVCACEFQARLGLSQSKASYHLGVLVDAGVVNREIRGTWSHYSIKDKQKVLGILDKLWMVGRV